MRVKKAIGLLVHNMKSKLLIFKISMFSFPEEVTWILIYLLVPWIKNRLSSFSLGFLDIFSHYNLFCSLSLLLLLLHCHKYGAKNVKKNVGFHFRDDSTLANQKARKTIEKPSKGLLWNQKMSNSYFKNLLNGPKTWHFINFGANRIKLRAQITLPMPFASNIC